LDSPPAQTAQVASNSCGACMYEATPMIDLIQKATQLSGEYKNVILAQFNDHVVRMSRMERPYFWHFHPNSDEIFLGIEGVVIVELEDQQIELGPGQLFTVPQGVRHRTAPAGCYSVNLIFERRNIETVFVDMPQT
jgi:mannose-6-phosphate isomerase-like protein (cupin superfamily)